MGGKLFEGRDIDLESIAIDRAQEVAEAARLARKAVDLGRDDAVALSYGGFVLELCRRRP